MVRVFVTNLRIALVQREPCATQDEAVREESPFVTAFQRAARENALAIGVANYCGKIGNGHSLELSGIAFKAPENGQDGESNDQVLSEGSDREELVVRFADIPIAELRAYRAREVWGGAWRRPQTYGELTDTGRAPSFDR